MQDKGGPKEPEVVSGQTDMVMAADNSTLMALQRAEIDQAITTARAYPRNISKFKVDCLSMATLDQETAESMTYALPRDGKLIQGPSVRLAEIAGSCWGNVRYGSRVIEIGDEYLTARGMCYDLERNVATEIDVRRRITNRHGKRFNADMIQTTGLAACSIALRNAIFKVVPAAYIKPVMEAAVRAAAGDEKTLAARRDAALLWFKGKGVTNDMVFKLLEVSGKDDINLHHIGQLIGIVQAVKDDAAKLEDFFAEAGIPKSPTGTTVSVDSLKGAAVTAKDDSKGPEPKPAEKTDEGAVTEPDGATTTEKEVAEAAAKFEDAKPEPKPTPTSKIDSLFDLEG